MIPVPHVVHSDPDILGGTPVFVGTRVPVRTMLDYLSAGDTLEEYQKGILAYYQHRISTGPLEGTNHKIKTMKRQSYGCRDLAFFKLKILGLHEAKHALVG